MTDRQFLSKYIKPFDKGLEWIFRRDKGFIVWRMGTGGNLEILHLRSFVFRKGYATLLISEMCRHLYRAAPYHSVFVFVLGSNKAAMAAYESFGFIFSTVEGLYRDDTTLIGTVPFETLKKNLGVTWQHYDPSGK